jgi:alpha-L-rhamnosidase
MAQESLGRFRYGDGAGALRLIRTAWTHMIDTGSGTPWEEIGIDGTPSNARPGTPLDDGSFVDLVHAWSTAVPALSTGVLGVRPVADGYRRWTVAPDPVDLTWAQGNVPVPGGTISVRWRRGADSFVLTTSAPRHTNGSVAIPVLGAERTIAMDGRIVWRDGHPVDGVDAHRDGDRIVFDGLTGERTFAWAR